MKKIIKAVLAFGLCLLLAVPVWADAQSGKQKPDYTTDYYMIVESKAGGIDIYSQPDFDSEKLNDELIPNGTALHIEGEVVDKDSNRTWGYTTYRGMNGYAPLDDCKPAESRQEAIDSELYIAGRDNVDYNADYDVKAYDESGSQHLYQGRARNMVQFLELMKSRMEKRFISRRTQTWLTDLTGVQLQLMAKKAGWIWIKQKKMRRKTLKLLI